MPGVMVAIAGTLSSGQGSGSLTVLFALLLGLALGLGVASLIFSVYFLRQNRTVRRRILRPPVHWSRQRSWRPPTVGGPCQWLAIRDSHPHLVQAALRLHDPTPCSWEEGLSAAHEHKMFIAPPVGGWTLVMGASLPEPADDVDACFHFLCQLSTKLGHIQFFSFNRSLQHHAWARLEHGRVGRAYAWAGKTLWNQGCLTEAERELGFQCYEYGEHPGRIANGKSNPLAVNTERLSLLAARWSVNPATIDLRFVKQGQGIAGRLSSTQFR